MAEEVAAEVAKEAPSSTKITDLVDSSIINDPLGYLSSHQDQIIGFGIDVLSAIAILIVGWLLAKIIHNISQGLMNRAKVEPTVSKFTANIIKYAVLAFTITAALAQVGIQTASFVAIIGAASFAVGMALQGSLSNFAAGVMLLLFRPIKVGEFIEAAGQTGTVQEITIFTTTLLSVDNKLIILPNSAVSSATIINYSRMEKRRVNIDFGVAYGSDLKKAKAALLAVFEADSRIIKEDGITVVIGSLGESSINITTRVWVKNADYWDVYFDNTEKAVTALTEAGIEIPFKTITVMNKNA